MAFGPFDLSSGCKKIMDSCFFLLVVHRILSWVLSGEFCLKRKLIFLEINWAHVENAITIELDFTLDGGDFD